MLIRNFMQTGKRMLFGKIFRVFIALVLFLSNDKTNLPMKRNGLLLVLVLILLPSCHKQVIRKYSEVLETTRKNEPLSPAGSVVYSGDSLRNIGFPAGGIGTGDILLGGRGNILELEIFGRADWDESPPYMTFFSLWFKNQKEYSGARILEGQLLNDFPNPFGVPREELAGIPRFESCRFIAEYPYARVILEDKDVPLKAALTAWNPFIPLDTDDSSLPMAIFSWKIENPGKDTVRSALAFNMGNPFRTYRNSHGLSGTVQYYGKEGLSAVLFTQDSPEKGEVMIATSALSPDVETRWYRGNWWDNAHVFWDDFSDDGRISDVREAYTYSSSDQDVATLSVPFTLPPGKSITIPYYVFWRMPVREREASMALGAGDVVPKTIHNYYAGKFESTPALSDYYMEREGMLDSTTRQYHDLLFSSTLPVYVLDALASNTAGMKSNLILRTAKGTVHAFEGLGNTFGCCPGNCTHVWDYAQSMAFLFPDLERNMRETNYLHDTEDDGYQSCRAIVPLGNYHMYGLATDGQLGTIMRAYREWKLSGDTEWLARLWPKIKASLEFTWKGAGKPEPGKGWMRNAEIPWDPGKQGVIRGNQPNTYDINFFGPNMLTGSLYLGALKAASEMADAMGDPQSAEDYRQLAQKGREAYEKLLWNGSYYEQKVEVVDGIRIPRRLRSPGDSLPKYQFEKGCLSDQLLGQFLADVTGLGDLLDSTHINRTLSSIYNHNFVKSFRDFDNVQRVYALNDESGLLLCSWPEGGKPLLPFVYSDEIWTGVEYQVAASLIWHGFVDEGLEVARAVRNRYRGYNRNPLGEIESGRYYARSMSSWALLNALTGYEYDGVSRSLSFDPKINRDAFFGFWSTGSAWGSFSVNKNEVTLRTEYGSQPLKTFSFTHPSAKRIMELPESAKNSQVNGDRFTVDFDDGFVLEKGKEIVIVMGN